MKKTLTMLSGLLLLGTFFTGCAQTPTYLDDQYPIDTRVNREFVIALNIDPIGEYFWEQEFDESRLELVESICVVCGVDVPSPVGLSGSYNTFRFRALQPGTTEIRLTHRDQSRGGVLAQRVFTVTIK